MQRLETRHVVQTGGDAALELGLQTVDGREEAGVQISEMKNIDHTTVSNRIYTLSTCPDSCSQC